MRFFFSKKHYHFFKSQRSKSSSGRSICYPGDQTGEKPVTLAATSTERVGQRHGATLMSSGVPISDRERERAQRTNLASRKRTHCYMKRHHFYQIETISFIEPGDVPSSSKNSFSKFL
jgi:hypothetical protein